MSHAAEALTDETVSEAVASIWELTVGASCQSAAANDVPGGLVGTVGITGDWEGTVSLFVSADMANDVARHMFELEEGNASPADREDAVGEVSNQVAGAIKSLLPCECALQIPSVQTTGVHGPPTGRQWWFQAGETQFLVSLESKHD